MMAGSGSMGSGVKLALFINAEIGNVLKRVVFSQSLITLPTLGSEAFRLCHLFDPDLFIMVEGHDADMVRDRYCSRRNHASSSRLR